MQYFSFTFIRDHNQLFTVIFFLLLLFGILLLPTTQVLRSIEVGGEAEVLELAEGESSHQEISLPAGTVSSLTVPIGEEVTRDGFRPEAYEDLKLTIQAGSETLAAIDEPEVVIENEKGLVRFDLHGVRLFERKYDFVISQAGVNQATLRSPHPDMLGVNERAEVALTLFERKSVVRSFFNEIYGQDLEGHDIYFYYHRGGQIVKGANPYTCTLTKDACKGYPSHLPGVYWLSAGIHQLVGDQFEDWIALWRPIMLSAWFLIGVVLFVYLYRLGYSALAVGALVFWLFNRWSLYVLQVAHTDFLGLLFLLLSVPLLPAYPLLAVVVLGISLSVKQLAVFVVPLFFIYLWRNQGIRGKRFVLCIGLVLIVPLLCLAPFLFNNSQAVMKGLFNPVTRIAQSDYAAIPPLSVFVGMDQAYQLLLMLLLILTVYVVAWRKLTSLPAAVMLVMAIMLATTPVLFHQYFVWLMPFIPLAVVMGFGGAKRASRS